MKKSKKTLIFFSLIFLIFVLVVIIQNPQLFTYFIARSPKQLGLNDTQIFLDAMGKQKDAEVEYVTDFQQKMSKISIIGVLVSLNRKDGLLIGRINPKPAGAEVDVVFGKDGDILSYRSSRAGSKAEEKAERLPVSELEKQLTRQLGRMVAFEILADIDPAKEVELRGSCTTAQCALLDYVRNYMTDNLQYARTPQMKKQIIGPVVEVNIGSNR